MSGVPSLAGKVALVTGASRGIGRGIALQLAEAGATVYVTGRPPKKSDNQDGTIKDLPTLEATAQELNKRGGKGVAVYCDHSNASDVEDLFKTINTNENGQLDILVNNAYSAVNVIADNWGKKFYEQDPMIWDDINNVGLRNHYICSVHAARMMVKRGKGGLIVMVSSAGGLQYTFNVAYGVGKAAVDRLAGDVAFELKKDGIACVSIWPGAVRTELFEKRMTAGDLGGDVEGAQVSKEEMSKIVKEGETPEYSGKCVVALAADSGIMSKTGRTLITGDLGDEYGFTDVDGRSPPNFRTARFALRWFKWNRLAEWVPEGLKVPFSLLSLQSSKF